MPETSTNSLPEYLYCYPNRNVAVTAEDQNDEANVAAETLQREGIPFKRTGDTLILTGDLTSTFQQRIKDLVTPGGLPLMQVDSGRVVQDIDAF